jgi:FkbM family methyltransferase
LTARLAYALAVHTFATPRGNPAVMHYRLATNDWNTINASMNEDEYGLAALAPLRGLAVDIGAYVGSVGIGLALDNPDLKVICVEPVPENAALIRWNIEANKLENRVSVLQMAAAAPDVHTTTVRWRYRGSELADHHAFVGNTSLIEGTGTTGVEFEEETVLCVSVMGLITRYGPIQLLKIDCEGGEWSALTDPAVAEIPLIVGEVHPTSGHRPSDLFPMLPSHGVVLLGDHQEAGPCGFRAVL